MEQASPKEKPEKPAGSQRKQAWFKKKGWSCPECGTTTTPIRRRMPDGRYFCNRCGVSVLGQLKKERRLHGSVKDPIAVMEQVLRERSEKGRLSSARPGPKSSGDKYDPKSRGSREDDSDSDFANHMRTLGYVCPITGNIFQEPVLAADDVAYEREAIMDWLKGNNTSPATGLVLANTDLRPATAVKDAVQKILLERANTLNLVNDSADSKPVRKREQRQPRPANPPAKVPKVEKKKKKEAKEEKELPEDPVQLFAAAERDFALGALGVAVETCRKAANMDYPPAIVKLGECYEQGLGVLKNASSAFEWYEIAAGFNDCTSLFKCGEAHLLGRGTPVDQELALDFFEEAAEQGHLHALYYLGLCHEQGKGMDGELSLDLAVDYYQKAADLGHVKSMTALALCLWEGKGVARDAKRALELLQQASALGDTQAQRELGAKLMTGSSVLPRDVTKAYEWTLRAAGAGDVDAQVQLGSYYAKGEGGVFDLFKARHWMYKAAQQGNARAECWLGVHQLTRDRSSVKEEAIKWLSKAGEQHNARALLALGHCHENGLHGMDVDLGEAFKWYMKGAQLGDFQAQYALGRFYEEGKGCSGNVDQAVAWYRKSIDSGNYSEALERLATCYRNGTGVPADAAKAEEFAKRADERRKQENVPLYTDL